MCNKMSDVRLSNASPTLERVDPARIIGLAALQDGGGGSRPPVRRNLFGSPDPEELQREWGALMAEERRRFAEQWSYDPVADRPLTGGDDVPPTGGCRWEEATDAPDFYRRAPHEKRRPLVDRDGNHNNNNRSGDAGRPAERSSPLPGGDSPDGSPRRRRQRASGPCLGDSPRKRLRCDDHDDEEDEDGQSNCTTAQTVTQSVVEETPSKADSREQLG